MSLREEIGEIYWAIDEGDHRIDEIINKVLDAAVEAVMVEKTDLDNELGMAGWAYDNAIEAINKLRGD